MAFEKKQWKDRIAEFINRRVLTLEDGSTMRVTVARDEGTVSEEGDAFSAKNMDDLEERIANEFSALNSNYETVALNSYATIRQKNDVCVLSLALCPLNGGTVFVTLPEKYIPAYVPSSIVRVKGVSGNYFYGVISIQDGIVKCSILTTYPTLNVSYDSNGTVDGDLVYFITI